MEMIAEFTKPKNNTQVAVLLDRDQAKLFVRMTRNGQSKTFEALTADFIPGRGKKPENWHYRVTVWGNDLTFFGKPESLETTELYILHPSAEKAQKLYYEARRDLEENDAKAVSNLPDEISVTLFITATGALYKIDSQNMTGPFFEQCESAIKSALFSTGAYYDVQKSYDGEYDTRVSAITTMGRLRKMVSDYDSFNKDKQVKEQKILDERIAEAKATGKNVILKKWTEEHHLPDSDWDEITQYVTPEGEIKISRSPAY